jgi:hypothetical protein
MYKRFRLYYSRRKQIGGRRVPKVTLGTLGEGTGLLGRQLAVHGLMRSGSCSVRLNPSQLEDPTLSGDTSLSPSQVAQCLRRMLELAATGGAQDGDSSTPWHADWFSSAELGFPLVADNFHRDVHPLIRQYVIPRIHAGDKTLESLLKFRGGVGNDHCEVCDHGTGSGPLILCDQCECTYHQHCLGVSAPGGGGDFICPKCSNTLEEIIHLRLRTMLPCSLQGSIDMQSHVYNISWDVRLRICTMPSLPWGNGSHRPPLLRHRR